MRFCHADFRLRRGKSLENTQSIPCVFVSAEQKSALPKIYDRKARYFGAFRYEISRFATGSGLNAHPNVKRRFKSAFLNSLLKTE